jgi:hypothetical protein
MHDDKWYKEQAKKGQSMGKKCEICGGPVNNSAKVLTCQKCRAKSIVPRKRRKHN